jgi:hypothetical protein
LDALICIYLLPIFHERKREGVKSGQHYNILDLGGRHVTRFGVFSNVRDGDREITSYLQSVTGSQLQCQHSANSGLVIFEPSQNFAVLSQP